SLAMAVAEALDIDEETAYRGMLQAQPDPGAMRIQEIKENGNTAYFVNGFAANDPVSTINIWKRMEQQGYPTERSIIIMNCRDDRTIQFAVDVLPHLPIDTLVLIGTPADPIIRAVREGKLAVNNLLDLQGYTTEEIYGELANVMDDNVIYGIGNIHGAAEPLI